MSINWRHVSSLAMILHEWATNSVKYGALGSDDGSLSVTWGEGPGGLTLVWLERLAQAPEPRPGAASARCSWRCPCASSMRRWNGSTTPRASG